MLDNLKTYVGHLHALAEAEREGFLSDPTRVGAAKYYLQTAITACLDLGNHIISAEQYRAPQDDRDVFNVLGENGAIPRDFALTMRRMVGLRNRLAHLYWEIDDAQIHDYLQTDLGDFDTFTQHILMFMQRQMPPAG